MDAALNGQREYLEELDGMIRRLTNMETEVRILRNSAENMSFKLERREEFKLCEKQQLLEDKMLTWPNYSKDVNFFLDGWIQHSQ